MFFVGENEGFLRLFAAARKRPTLHGNVDKALYTRLYRQVDEGAVALIVHLLEGQAISLAANQLQLSLAVTGMIGDLAESLVKRDSGAKDSGNLLPGNRFEGYKFY